MAFKTEMIWWKTSENPHPSGPVDEYCVIKRHKRGTEIAVWNNDHKCWDREDGDDYKCGVEDVEFWAIIPKCPY